LTTFATVLESLEHFEAMKTSNSVFSYKNIIPIPHLLTKTFMNLPYIEPCTVARAFFEAMHDYDSQLDDIASALPAQDTKAVEPDLATESDNDANSKPDNTPDIPMIMTTPSPTTHPKFMTDFIHVIQFCHLCAKGKIPPALYTLNTSSDIQSWLSSVSAPFKIDKKTTIAKQASSIDDDDLSFGDEISSPDQKISKKDHYFISTMLKLHNMMDRNNLKQSKEKDEHEPGFNRLELHQKN
jgi:hypothetical protein